jgi:hypothetical protein
MQSQNAGIQERECVSGSKINGEFNKIRKDWEKWKKTATTFALAPDVILRYFINRDENLDAILKAARTVKIRIVTTEAALITALNCLEEDELLLDDLIEFLKVVELIPSPTKLKFQLVKNEKRIEYLRNLAKNGEQTYAS